LFDQTDDPFGVGVFVDVRNAISRVRDAGIRQTAYMKSKRWAENRDDWKVVYRRNGMNLSQMHTKPIVLALVLLGGCADASFKMGADATQLRADRKACEASSDVNACMEGKGWSSLAFKKDSASSEVTEESPALAQAQPREPDQAAVASSPTVLPSPATSEVKDFRVAHGKPPKPRAAAKDPMTLVKVTSWWKLGGSKPQDDIKACVAALGSQHAPDYIAQTVTQGLISCMAKAGWHAA